MTTHTFNHRNEFCARTRARDAFNCLLVELLCQFHVTYQLYIVWLSVRDRGTATKKKTDSGGERGRVQCSCPEGLLK